MNKKNFYTKSGAFFLFLSFITILYSCKKDKEAPVVSLIGSASIDVTLEGTYTEFGATALDNKDGSITPTISSNVDTKNTGTYTVTYTAKDEAGNTGSATRTVNVKNSLHAMSGTYNVIQTISGGSPVNYIQTVTASSTKNNQLVFGKFCNRENNNAIKANVIGSNISYSLSQGANNVGNPPTNYTYTNLAGTLLNNTSFTLGFTEIGSGSPVNYSETFVKQ